MDGEATRLVASNGRNSGQRRSDHRACGGRCRFNEPVRRLSLCGLRAERATGYKITAFAENHQKSTEFAFLYPKTCIYQKKAVPLQALTQTSTTMNKVSLRFYKDYKVRAVWDEKLSKWWFSVLDVVGAINEQEDYKKTRNYWKYLKTKLKNEGSEVVSATNQLKQGLASLCPDRQNRRPRALHEGHRLLLLL